MKDESISLLSILQRKLKYERRLAESTSEEINNSENVLMSNINEKNIIKSDAKSSISDIQSKEIDITESQIQHDERAWKYQRATARDAEITQVIRIFNFRDWTDTDELIYFMSCLQVT